MNAQEQSRPLVTMPGDIVPPHPGDIVPPRRTGSIVLPILLIGLGILFFLNTLDVIDWSAWDNIWRLWPLVLIAFGLEILVGRRSALGSLVIAGLLLLTVALALTTWAWQSPSGQVVTTETISQPLQGATEANVNINFGVGTLRLNSLTDSNELVAGSVIRGDHETLTQDYHGSGGTVYYTLQSRTDWLFPFFDNGQGNRTWDIGLNTGVPIDLSVSTGVGNATLDLEKLNLTRLNLNTGTGDTSITLPAHGNFDAKLDVGVGDVNVNIPKGLEASIQLNLGLRHQQLPANYVHQGDTYESPGYRTAKDRVDLDISGGVGNIVVHEVGSETAPEP